MNQLAEQSISENQAQVNFPDGYISAPLSVVETLLSPDQLRSFLKESPSLVYSGRGGALTRDQKRRYGQILSWCKEALGRGCQLIRVDLTSGEGRGAEYLKRDFQELRRRVERRFKYKIEFYRVETSEGRGVYHMIWAIEGKVAVYVPQSWLSSQWREIHGAHRVWIKRMGGGKKDPKNVAKYLVTQYLAGQKAHVRVSWSWWRARIPIVKSWKFMLREFKRRSDISTFCGLNVDTVTLTFADLIKAWDGLLERGWCMMGNFAYFISGREIDFAKL